MSPQRALIHRSVIPVTLIDLNDPLIYRALLLLELKQKVVPYLSDDRCKNYVYTRNCAFVLL